MPQHIAITVFDHKFRIRNRLSGDGIQLREGQAAHGVVIEAQSLGILGIDHDGLALIIGANHITIRGLFLCDHQGAGHLGDLDLPVGIREVDAIRGQLAALGIHYAPVGVEHLELRTSQRSLGDGIQLFDQQSPGPLVPEGQALDLAAFD